MATNYADILLADGDIDLSSYSLQIIESNQASLKQRLDLRFAIWQGEWKYFYEYGTPWRSYLGLGISKAQSVIDQEIKRQTRKEEDVINIYNFKSSINKRIYTCSFDIMTSEGSVAYAMNLKDDFTYEIPSYSSGCDKIVEYQYWSSAPYDLLCSDKISNHLVPISGSLLDKYLTNDYISVENVKPVTGELRDIVFTYTTNTEDKLSGDVGMSLSDVTFIPSIIYKTQDQSNEDRLSGDIGMELTSTALTLAIRYITQNQPNEDKLSGDVGMELTTTTLTKTI